MTARGFMDHSRGGRQLQGPEAIAAAEEIRQQRASKGQWPYPWSYPPPGAIRVSWGLDTQGTLAVPVAATPTQALLYTVDQGYQFALYALVVEYLNDGVQGAVNPGDFTWSMTLNQPVGIGNFQGSAVQGFTNVDVPIGTLQIPWPLEEAELFDSNDQIRIVVTNTNLANGAPNFIKAILLGWKWPVA